MREAGGSPIRDTKAAGVGLFEFEIGLFFLFRRRFLEVKLFPPGVGRSLPAAASAAAASARPIKVEDARFRWELWSGGRFSKPSP